MSKRKVGKLYRKRIVEGNINEVNPNSEVHIDSLKGGESTDGGGNFSPDAIVYEPNGWYWRWVEGVPSDFPSAAQTLFLLKNQLGAKYYDGLVTDTTAPIDFIFKAGSILDLGAYLQIMRDSTDNRGYCVIAVAESKYCSLKVDDTTTITGNSLYEIASQMQPITETEFEGMCQQNFGLLRITKEEYEALISE